MIIEWLVLIAWLRYKQNLYNKYTSQNHQQRVLFFQTVIKLSNVSDWFSLANFNNHTPRVLRLLNDPSKKTVIQIFTCEVYDEFYVRD